MKKLLFVLMLLGGISVYSQDYRLEKEQLKAQLKEKLKSEYTTAKLDQFTVEELKEKIKELDKNIKGKYNDSTKAVVYDFNKKVYTVSNVIPKVGEPLVLKIENINRLAYDVAIKSSDVAIVDEYFNDEIKTAVRATYEMPEKLLPVEEKTITEPLILNKADVKDDAVKAKDVKTISTYNGQIQANNKLILDLKGGIAGLEKTIISLRNDIKKDSLSLVANSNQPDLEKEIINDKVEILKNLKDIELKNIEISKIELDIRNLETEINKLKSNSELISSTFFHLKQIYTNILNHYLVIKNIETEYDNFKQLALNPLLNFKTYGEKRSQPEFITNKLPSYREEVSKFNKLINDFNDAFYSAMYGYNSINSTGTEYQMEYIRSKYQQIKDEVEKIKSNAETIDLPGKILKVNCIDAILIDEKAYEILSAPIQPFEDYVTFDVEVKHRDSKRLAEYDDNRKFTYMEYTQGGVRFDFSVGAVFNFGGNNNKYEIKDITVETITGVAPDEVITTTNKKQIVLTEDNKFIPMLSGMFHTSFRRNGNYAFGLTLGASINVETFEFNSLFPGVSLLIGKKQKLILTAGPAFRQVDILKNNYQRDGIYDVGEFSDSSQLTAKQFQIGGFFGITYNLTQKQRGKFKISGAE